MLKMSIAVGRGWVAVDPDGSVYWYQVKPKWSNKQKKWIISGDTDAELLLERNYASERDGVDAKTSLMRVKTGKINVFVTQGEGE